MGGDATELTILAIVDGYRVRYDDVDRVVNGVKIAGNELSFTGGEVTLEATDFKIEGEYDPYLLVESAEWYAEPDDGDDADECEESVERLKQELLEQVEGEMHGTF